MRNLTTERLSDVPRAIHHERFRKGSSENGYLSQDLRYENGPAVWELGDRIPDYGKNEYKGLEMGKCLGIWRLERRQSAGDEAGVGAGTRLHGLAGHMMRLLVKHQWLEQLTLEWGHGGRGHAWWVEAIIGGAEVKRNIQNCLQKHNFRKKGENEKFKT